MRIRVKTRARAHRDRTFLIVPQVDFVRLALRAQNLHGKTIRLPDPLAETAEHEVVAK